MSQIAKPTDPKADLQEMRSAILDLAEDLKERFVLEESRVLTFVHGKLKEAASAFEQEIRNITIAAQEAERGVGSGRKSTKK